MAEFTIQNLIDYLTYTQVQNTEEEKTSKFVIYARKSTSGDEKQERSLSDQIIECEKFANDNNLYYRKNEIIQESASAKNSGGRPLFNQMIADIKKGKYQGIISWHPDRLARNMKDAGEIIDLLDKGTIKELRFPSFHFYNDDNGKVLLGMAFVLAKQYSEGLSKNVKRGVDRSTQEGKSIHIAKKGYLKDREGLLRPDGDNFNIIQRAWKMRLEGSRLQDIVKYLNNSGYLAATGRGEETKHVAQSKFSINTLSNMFQDPAFAGVLKYGGNVVNLTEIYNFQPMITAEEYRIINGDKNVDVFKRFNRRVLGIGSEPVKADLLRGRVHCSHCGEKMTTGITPKKNASTTGKTNYFFFRCINKECDYYGKSVRARVVVNFVRQFLKDNQFIYTKEGYIQYKTEMAKKIKENGLELNRQRSVLINKKTSLVEKMISVKEKLKTEKDDKFSKIFKEDYIKYEDELGKNQVALAELEDKIAANKDSVLTFEQFVELFKNLPLLLEKASSMEAYDYIIKNIFLNFYVSMENGTGLRGEIADYVLNSPFKELHEKHLLLLGGPGWT